MTHKKMTIPRSKWLRKRADGKFTGNAKKSCLLNSTGNMCCLGFYCRDILGISDRKMLYKGSPYDIGIREDEQYVFSNLMGVNDRTNENYPTADQKKLSNVQQEKEIKQLFRKGLKVDVTFVD